MKLIVTPSALRKANREDLFAGDIYNLHAVQYIKDNTTVFYQNPGQEVNGPYKIDNNAYFPEIYKNMLYGFIKILTAVPAEPKDEILFDLVLRQAYKDEIFDCRWDLKYNRIFYKYSDNKTHGPNYTDSSTTVEFLTELLSKNQIYVPYERQHFKCKEFKKIAWESKSGCAKAAGFWRNLKQEQLLKLTAMNYMANDMRTYS